MLILTRSDVLSLLDMGRVIEAVDGAHRALATGAGTDLGPVSLAVPSSSMLLLPMCSTVPEGFGGVKLLTDYAAESGDTRRQQSTVALVNTVSGTCEAVLDGGAITRFRTAAASAVATRHLARPDAEVLGFVGAGALARTHLLALISVRRISRVLVWSRSTSTGSGFAEFARTQGVEVEVCDSPESVVSKADVVCTLTPSKTPVVLGRWFHPGLHVNVVGAPPRPEYREVDTDGIRCSRVVVDSVAVASKKAGDLLIPLAERAIDRRHFEIELGDVLIGRRTPRTRDDDVTLFKSVGIAVQDIATAVQVLELARQKGVGHHVELTS